MNIAIDARMIKSGSMHGIARYVFELLRGLADHPPSHTFFAVVNDDSPLLKGHWPEHIRFIKVRASWISFAEQWEIPQALKSIKADLFHAPSFVAPMVCPCAMVMTIHDLNHLVLPQFYTPLHQLYYRFFVRSCIQRSRFILTVSNFSKNEIVQNLDLSPNKVAVTYNGVSNDYQHVEDSETIEYVRELYELPDKFILCVSNNKPHKNVHQLVRAFCYSSIDIPLVLACPVDTSLLEIAEACNKKHLIYFSKFIAEEHLPSIYSMTHLFVYPSTYEGFGLPPLEAICCGTPVVVARSSSLPEVVGKHAIFADPFDHCDIARALEAGVNNRNLRESLMQGVEQHREKFSWKSMTEQTLATYNKCLEPDTLCQTSMEAGSP